MKPQVVVGFAFLVTLAIARVAPPVKPLPDFLRLDDLNSTHADNVPVDWTNPATGGDGETPWDKAVEIGRTLYFAMKSKDSIAAFFFKNYPEFAGTVQSPWDGDLREELRSWGYNDNDELSDTIKNDCDFEKSHNIKRAFDELGLDTRAAADGGPNHCLRVDHYNGAIVKREEDGTFPMEVKQVYENCGKEYRVTGAGFEFAMNPNGAIALMNVMSAAWSAEKNLWHKKPKVGQLPQLRSTADIAWGLWNRVAADDLQNIKYFFVTQILNPGTREILRQAYRRLTPPKSEDEKWPGIEFSMETVEGQAILGSPVGRWAGYFLLQHKKQLGGNRFIFKVRAFKNDAASLPYLVFYVDPTPWPDNPNQKPGEEPAPLPAPVLPDTSPETTQESVPGSRRDMVPENREEQGWSDLRSTIVRRSADGKSVMREHMLRAKL